MFQLGMAFLMSYHALADISVVDSRINPLTAHIFVDDCIVEVPKKQLKDVCFILKRVNKECSLDLDIKECRK